MGARSGRGQSSVRKMATPSASGTAMQQREERGGKRAEDEGQRAEVAGDRIPRLRG